jgi:hypothetical protein
VDTPAIVRVLIEYYGWPIVAILVALWCVVLLNKLAKRMMTVNENIAANLMALAAKLELATEDRDIWGRRR